jgi:hypothetical protein
MKPIISTFLQSNICNKLLLRFGKEQRLQTSILFIPNFFLSSHCFDEYKMLLFLLYSILE